MPAKPIRLYWWSRSNMTNMGDELSRDIVRFVSGRPVERADQETADMLAIGSIIGFPQRAHERTQPYLVWGSGTLENSQRARQEAFAFSAVRGPLTLSTLNNHRTVPFGDPGILTSQLWPHDGSKRYRWGLIPHFKFADQPWIQRILDATPNCVLIDVRDPDIEKTCRTIASCEYIASMSLHGLIIADSYGVPSLWLNEESISSAWKYFDYFTGVGRRNTLAVTYNKPADLTVYEPKLVKNPHFGTLPTTMKRLAAAFPL